jgi:hypothetical protein
MEPKGDTLGTVENLDKLLERYKLNMELGGKKIDENLLKEALGRQKRLCVGFNKETGEKLYRHAVKLSK